MRRLDCLALPGRAVQRHRRLRRRGLGVGAAERHQPALLELAAVPRAFE